MFSNIVDNETKVIESNSNLEESCINYFLQHFLPLIKYFTENFIIKFRFLFNLNF